MNGNNLEKCHIPEKWCGNGKLPPKDPEILGYYYKTGTPYECLKKGIGAGKYSTEKIPIGSLRNIRYIGPVYEKRLSIRGIKNLRDLQEKCLENNFQNILQRAFKKKTTFDPRPYNSVIWYLTKMGYKLHFECVKIPEEK